MMHLLTTCGLYNKAYIRGWEKKIFFSHETLTDRKNYSSFAPRRRQKKQAKALIKLTTSVIVLLQERKRKN